MPHIQFPLLLTLYVTGLFLTIREPTVTLLSTKAHTLLL